MSEKDEKQERPDVEGHAHGLTDEASAHGLIDDDPKAHGAHGLNEDDDTPDVEGHFHAKSPAREHPKKRSE